MASNSSVVRMWGHFEHNLDDKGRVVVPLKFREALGEEFVLTMGPGNHIRAFPLAIWQPIEDQLLNADMFDELNEDVMFLQRLYGNCEFVSPDQQNRLSLPRYLRTWAGLEEGDTAVVLGVGTRVEIWSRSNWEAINKEFTQPNAARAAAQRKLGTSGATNSAKTPSVEVSGDSVPISTEGE